MIISEYIIKKLKENGCYHVAGIPGTSCAGFFNAIDRDNEIEYIVTTNELEAGYIADGYGRFGGFGAVCVSYGVGTLSLVNAVASAFTERVPLVVINGGPSEEDLRIERDFGSLFSHSTGAYQTDLNVFRPVTTFAKIITHTSEAKFVIDEAFDKAKLEQRPVYIELPQDSWSKELEGEIQIHTPSKPKNNINFISAAESKLKDAKSPILFIGVEVVRKELRDKVLELIEKWDVPFVTTALSKSYISEKHPNFVGCYDSDLFHKKDIFRIIDESDCPIGLGCIWGIDHRAFIIEKFDSMIEVSFNAGRVSDQRYTSVNIEIVIDHFLNWEVTSSLQSPETPLAKEINETSKFGHDQVFSAINGYIKFKDNIQIIMDTCLGSFPGADLQMPGTDMYLANPVWLSIGQGTPAAVGAYLKNRKPPIVISGDGGFQMVAQSFSTMVKYQIPALLIILDNSLYAIEQYLIDGSYFNEDKPPLKYVELNRWSYEAFPKVFSGGYGKRVHTIEELTEVLNTWENNSIKEPWIIACEIPKKDLPSN